MLRRNLLHLIVCFNLLSGCYSSPASIPPEPASSSTPELIKTAALAVPSPASSPTVLPATAHPGQTAISSEEPSHPGLNSTPTLTPILAAQAFHNCSLTPDIISCDPSALSIAGHVAFYDTENNRLVALDLKTGQGWTVTMPQPRELEWSPDGSQLLVRVNYFFKEKSFAFEYLLFEKDGKFIQQRIVDKFIEWQPQGAELRASDQPKIVRSLDGAEAWLESSPKGQVLHFRPSGNTVWKTAKLDISLTDRYYELYEWIPGTLNIIFTRGTGSAVNSLMLGEELYLFNTQTEELRSLGLNGYSRPQFGVIHAPYLAMLQLFWGTGNDTLAILDGKTGKISYPFPNAKDKVRSPYAFRQIAWQPGNRDNEGLLVLMVSIVPTGPANQPTAVSPIFPKSGIYLYNRRSDKAQILIETPENSIGGNFYWTADGQYLLYCLDTEKSKESSQISLYVRQIDTGKEWLLLDHLANPYPFISYTSWNLIAVSMH